MADFDKDAPTYLLCHHGIRSYRAAQFLCVAGFTQVYNISGGIDAYALTVDKSVPVY